MKYIKQLTIIMLISFTGECLKALLPLTIPASIYGLIIMLFLLSTKLLPLSKVEETADFLVGIMSVMFIPAAVGVIDSWGELKQMLIPVVVITVVTTVVVMVVTGRLTQLFMRKKGGK